MSVTVTPSMRTGLIQFAIGGVAGPALFAVLNWASVQVITEPMSSRTGLLVGGGVVLAAAFVATWWPVRW